MNVKGTLCAQHFHHFDGTPLQRSPVADRTTAPSLVNGKVGRS
jgi:hypothetical protein